MKKSLIKFALATKVKVYSGSPTVIAWATKGCGELTGFSPEKRAIARLAEGLQAENNFLRGRVERAEIQHIPGKETVTSDRL